MNISYIISNNELNLASIYKLNKMKNLLLLLSLSLLSVFTFGQKLERTQRASKISEFKYHMSLSAAKDAYTLLKTDSLWAYERTSNSGPKKKNVLKSTTVKKALVDTAYTFPWIGETQQWDTVPNGKIVYTYDSQYNLTNYLSLIWNTSSSSWQNSSQIMYTYDLSNQLSGILQQNWKNKGKGVYAWVNSIKKASTYDSLNRKSNYLAQTWNVLKNKWVNIWQQNFTYDSVGNNTLIIESAWNASINNWMPSYNFINQFDSLNRNELNTIQFSEGDSWVNALQTSNNYDNDGNNIMTLSQSWNSETEAWENSELDSVYYVNSNKIDKTIIKLWDSNLFDWYNVRLNIYEYDSLGNNISMVSQDYDPNNFSWFNNSKNIYGYDSLKTQISSAILYWNLGAYNWSSGTLTKLTISYYNVLKSSAIQQSDNSTVEKQTVNATIEVFPNPAVDFVTIQNTNYVNEVQVFDLSGSKILQNSYNGLNNISLDISNLKPGIYILYVKSSDGRNIPQKIVKK